MKGYAGTTPTVDAIAKINFSGSCTVIPRLWREWLKRDSGKINSVAIDVLAEIVYWYRPIADIDESTGKHLGWRRKFKSDKLQKSYEQLSSSLGHTKRQVKDAVIWLESKGFISREFRTIGKCNNVLFVEVNAEAVARITFQAPEPLPRSNDRPYDVLTGEGVTFKREAYTEITPEISNKDYLNKEESLSAIDSFSLNSDLSSHDGESSNHSDNGLGGSDKRKSSAKKKSSVPKPVKKSEPMDKYNDAGYVVFPTKGRYAAHGALAMRFLHCEILAGLHGLTFTSSGGYTWIGLAGSDISGFGIETDKDGDYCLVTEDFLLEKMPLGMIQRLNDSSDDRAFDFPVEQYNERALYWWDEVKRVVEANNSSAKDLNDEYRGSIFAKVFGESVRWVESRVA